MIPSILITTCILSLFFLTQLVNSQTPTNIIPFTIINHGNLSGNVAEYGATYRQIHNFSTFPFSLCFYNTTPNAYVLAIRTGVPFQEEILVQQETVRWVWDANRRRPVGESATLTLRQDGNLVLAEPNGLIAWQTNTANRGVVGIKLLQNGNLVLHDRRGRFIWQSFDHPVDTLLVGMSLNRNDRRRLIGRSSDADGSDGPYSLVFEENGVIMYLNYSGQLIRYADWSGYIGDRVTFTAEPENYVNSPAYKLVLEYDGTPPPPFRRRVIQKVNYNATYSFLRIGSDGNVRMFTYNDKVGYSRWEQTFAYFPDYHPRECALPSRCGQFGLCDRGMCVACPSPKGLLGWNEGCAPPQLGQCDGRAKADYYNIRGAEHFLTLLVSADGRMTVAECRRRCSRDCKCKGFVYQEDTSLCLTVPLLATLIREVNTSVVYVKYFK